ncbi:protein DETOXIFICATION 35-like [Telopea speciosissima]|uniref:protein DETOXIFICATION 35-like n=1 Tax=Telopea speciosissima TaxID=54955 RepID=UPI001CC74A64|nr:protein DETOXIFICATION 35-like [Telopea speciosissima]
MNEETKNTKKKVKEVKIAKDRETEDQQVGRSSKSSSRSSTPRSGSRSSSRSSVSPGMEAPLIDSGVSIEPCELRPAPSTVVESGEGDYLPVESFADVRSVVWKESVKLWVIAGPIAFNILCLYGTNSFTQIFVGHVGNFELSAVAISLSVISNFSFGFLLGMGSALETLCGQAFGAGQVFMLGIYMQRSWIILTVSCFLLSPVYIFATPILKFLGQEHDIAVLTGKFSVQIIPQMFSLAINFPTQKFLQAQSKVGVLAWIAFVTLLLHVFLLWLFISVIGMGISGAAMAYNISAWWVSIAQVIYVVNWCKDGWKGLSWLAFKEIWAFVRLSLASAIMLCLEIWYMMILVVLTGHLGDAVIAVASISICMNVNGWEGMLFIGINAAISVRVSNELGSGHHRAAKYSVFVIVAQSLVIGLFFMVVILATKDYFAVLFTDSKDLQRAVSHLAPLLGVTMVLNSIQPVISGVAVGGGWQGLVAYINLGCYYIFGLPLGFLLGYKTKMRVEGIWSGMLCGTALQTLILLFIIWKTDWKDEAEQATERVRMWGGQDKEDENFEMDSH